MAENLTRVLTPEEARTAELPSLLHPIQRLGRLAQLGAAMGVEGIYSRHSLVVHAEFYQAGENLGHAFLNLVEAKGLVVTSDPQKNRFQSQSPKASN